jgi:hypothetical protein
LHGRNLGRLRQRHRDRIGRRTATRRHGACESAGRDAGAVRSDGRPIGGGATYGTWSRLPVSTCGGCPAPQSAASDLIVTAWNAVLPWIDYGVNLTDYVLGFIPFGYLIGDQVSIVYYSLVRPVANSFVVNLVAPVVNAPLNINSYLNGLAALGSVTVTSLINLGINEFNYFFGWLIPPIPPIGLAAKTVAAEQAAASLATPLSATTAETGPLVERHSAVHPEALTTDIPVKASAETTKIATDTAPADTEEATAPNTMETATPTRKDSASASSGTVQAQGEVRESATPTEKATDATKVPTDDKGDKGDKPDTAKRATESAASSTPTSHETGKKDAIDKKK